MYPRYPTPEQWRLFTLYQSAPPPMAPMEFLQHWDLDYSVLAQVTSVSFLETAISETSPGSEIDPTPLQRMPLSKRCPELMLVPVIFSVQVSKALLNLRFRGFSD